MFSFHVKRYQRRAGKRGRKLQPGQMHLNQQQLPIIFSHWSLNSVSTMLFSCTDWV